MVLLLLLLVSKIVPSVFYSFSLLFAGERITQNTKNVKIWCESNGGRGRGEDTSAETVAQLSRPESTVTIATLRDAF